ncbi:unnamed protein product [Cylicocyclus nassatus]|uniref:Inhibitor of growth protein n=1 Tax=Cylicocyclus nassatus TaxID=53992 RepID=A0AA36H255_CYLNA|nr:unnamed protein product [Cylicocyclus nassatus]
MKLRKHIIMAEQLKKYMEKLDDLPPFIRKNAEEIRELDEKVEKIMHDIQIRTVAHVKNLKKTTREQRVKWYKEVQAMYKEADKLSERKVKLAQKMYDTVDTHIKEMDQQLVEFQEFQVKKYSEGQLKASTSGAEGQKRKGAVAAIKGDRKKKPNDSKTRPDNPPFMESFKPSAITAVDMPVDPNEPTYCICHQVSFGQMVACDGPDCKNEWFHFQCVGLTSSPVGKWYCDQCKEARKKKIKQ